MKTLWIVLGLVVVGGGVYAATMNKNTKTEVVKDETSQTETHTTTPDTGRYKAEFNERTSMKVIAESGGSYQCTVNSDAGGAQTTGTVYISNKKVRGDFESKLPQVNMTVKTSFVSDTVYAYTWSDAMPQGVKIKIAVTDASMEQNNYEQMLDYSCKFWTADNSKFVVPTTITFKEVNAN